MGFEVDDATQRITAVHCQPTTAAGAAAAEEEEDFFTLEADAVVFAVGMKALKFFGGTGPLAEYETFRRFGNLRGTDVLAVRLFLNTKLPPPTGGVPSSSSENKNTYSANACWGFDGGGVGMTVFDRRRCTPRATTKSPAPWWRWTGTTRHAC